MTAPLSDEEFVALQHAVRNKDQDACRLLHDRFAPNVHATCHRLLATRAPNLRPLLDSTVLTNDVFAAFFTRLIATRTFGWCPRIIASL